MSEAKRTRLYESGWRYVPAASTNVAATFARIRREQKAAEQIKPSTVRPLKKKGAP